VGTPKPEDLAGSADARRGYAVETDSLGEEPGREARHHAGRALGKEREMETVYTAPNGQADVVRDEGVFRVRERRTDGGWYGPAGRYGWLKDAQAAADRVDAWVAKQAGRRSV